MEFFWIPHGTLAWYIRIFSLCAGLDPNRYNCMRFPVSCGSLMDRRSEPDLLNLIFYLGDYHFAKTSKGTVWFWFGLTVKQFLSYNRSLRNTSDQITGNRSTNEQQFSEFLYLFKALFSPRNIKSCKFLKIS